MTITITRKATDPLCPYCKNLMWKCTNGYGAWWYECNCGTATPIVGNEENARTVALDYHNRDDTDEICALRARVENLTLYLQEAIALCPGDLAVLDEWHPGLPGYAPPQGCESCKIEPEESHD